MKDKGFTIIENIVGIVVISILLLIGSTMIINLITAEKMHRNSLKINDSVDNFIVDLEFWLAKEDYKNIEVVNDEELILHYKDIYNCKKLKYKNNNQIVIETINICEENKGDNNRIKDSKVMLEKVEKFHILKKENIYYIRINMESGEEIIKCL